MRRGFVQVAHGGAGTGAVSNEKCSYSMCELWWQAGGGHQQSHVVFLSSTTP